MNRRMMVVAMTFALAAPGGALGADKAKEQAEVRKAGQDALAAVYKAQPSARKAIESAAGYAAFSNFGMKILVAGGGSGQGHRGQQQDQGHDLHEDGRGAGGLGHGRQEVPGGLGVRDRERAQQLRQLRLGVRCPGDRGGEDRRQGFRVSGRARGVAGGLDLSGHGQAGLALELTAKGTKYWDSDLN
ncbi:MAG: hypothetical protein IPN24_06260 [Betaproteobacteria bacterium]|nr:hypothetical protein [Betaproteobacteria bacterium]